MTQQVEGTLQDEHAAHGDRVTIDLTPESLKTPEGAAKVAEAMREFDDASHALANAAIEFFDTHEEDMLYQFHNENGSLPDDVHQVRALIGARNRKQNAMLAAIGGR